MPTPTYTPLATITLGANASSVTFSSIPATYRDLIVIYTTPSNISSSGFPGIRLNNDTGSNYDFVLMQTSADIVQSTSGTLTRMGLGATDTRAAVCQILDYSATDKFKPSLLRYGTADNTTVQARATTWKNTSAVTSLVFMTTAGQYQSGTTFSLYGIAA